MQIQGEQLTLAHVDLKVTYIPRHAKGDASHPDCESGTLVRSNDTYVFVRYASGVKATRPEDLVWG